MPSFHAFARIFSAVLGAGALGACAAAAQPAATPAPGPDATGPMYVTLLGNYVGRALRIEVDGAVIHEGRLTFPPPGAEHRYTLAVGPARSAQVQVTIEGCDQPWTGEISLAPMKSAYLLFEGCEVEALRPD